MASQEEVFHNRGREQAKSPLLKKTDADDIPKDNHVKKKRKRLLEEQADSVPVFQAPGEERRMSSSEESWNITSSPSRSPSPTKTPYSLKTTLKKIKKEGRFV